MSRVRRRTHRALSQVARRLAVRRGLPVEVDELRLVSTVGYQLHVHVHRPALDGRWPGVVLCPGTEHPGTVFDGWTEPVNADELASRGIVALHFDPAGRGRSWGEEDYGGEEHQDDVRVAVRYLLGHPAVDPQRTGVVAISLGIAMACGALARYADELPVRFLLDWEGPSDREIITSGWTLLAPAMGHGPGDEDYWRPREAVRHVGHLRCGYQRLQARPDHAQPRELRHATRMIQAAASGDLPWFALNDHPRGEVPASPRWLPGGLPEANRHLLRHLDLLLGPRGGA